MTIRRTELAVALLAVIGISGCGGETTPTSANNTGGAESATAATDNSPSAPLVATARDGRTKWIGDIPYDVWYERPLDTFRDTTPIAGAPITPTAPTADTTPGPTPDEPVAPVGGGDNAGAIVWSETAPIEILLSEVKELRNRLNTDLQTVATYNRSIDEISLDGMMLLAMAAVIEQHDEAAPWQANAKYVRDLAYEVYVNAEGSGRAPFQATQTPFESIVTILDGGSPPEIEADDKPPFGDTVDRSVMMTRIEESMSHLKSNVNTPTRMKEEAESATREATVMKAIAGIMMDGAFDYADQPEYQQYVREFLDGNAAMVQAIEADDFAAFETARNRVQSSCDPCHRKYRTGDSDF